MYAQIVFIDWMGLGVLALHLPDQGRIIRYSQIESFSLPSSSLIPVCQARMFFEYASAP